jgi:hypothetical protein
VVETSAAGVEALQPVYGREAGFGVGEGEKFARHAAPVAQGRVLGQEGEVLGQVLGEAALCGDVGEGVGGAVGEDVGGGDLEDGDAGGELEEAAGDGYWLYGKDALAKTLMIPETFF